MSNFPSLTGKQVVKILQENSFDIIRIKGSHHFLRHIDGRCTVVPVHGRETIGSGLLAKILRDCEMTKKELL